MKKVNLETGILKYALEVFNNTTGVNYAINEDYQRNNGELPDAIIRLRRNGEEYEYAVEIKRRLTKPILGTVINQVHRFWQKGMIITDYVNPNIAEKLKEMDIAFIDCVGNAYIREPGLYIFTKGNKPDDVEITRDETVQGTDQHIYPETLKIAPQIFPPTIMREPRNPAFQPAGLKVVFAFLCDPELAKAPYREIAKTADVALGTIGRVIKGLKKDGFLIERKKYKRRRVLIDRKRLLEEWVEAYNRELRPTLDVGRFDIPEYQWWDKINIGTYGAKWGGEVAAAKLTHYLKPEMATIYAKEIPTKLLQDFKMRRDPKGNVEILKQFWDDKYNLVIKNTHNDIAPIIIIYADLLATGDARKLETARIIYEQEIPGLIGEN